MNIIKPVLRWGKLHKKIAGTGGIAIVACLLATAAVSASIPDAQGVIHGCRLNTGGTLRIIDSASASCNGLETTLN